MPITLTLTLDPETLAALVAGDVTTLKATLKQPKVRASAPLDPATAAVRDEVLALWQRSYPEHDPGRVWKALKPLADVPELADAVATALDYNTGRVYPPEWLRKDLAQWQERADMDPFAQMDDRARYRAKLGLKG